MTLAFVSGLVLGFFGSAHCIGMCGPLVLALPPGDAGRTRFFVGRIAYNMGRVVTYVGFGAILGFIGGVVPMPGFQRAVSIGAGASVILIAAIPRIGRLLSGSSAPFARLTAAVSDAIGRMIRRTSVPAMFGLGVLNGLLPCGFVYLAIAGALASGSTATGMAFMAGFGIGTIPAMLGLALFPKLVSPSLRQKAVRLLPAFTVLVGILLIVRGLGLGIPYLSPKLMPPAVQTEQPCCQ